MNHKLHFSSRNSVKLRAAGEKLRGSGAAGTSPRLNVVARMLSFPTNWQCRNRGKVGWRLERDGVPGAPVKPGGGGLSREVGRTAQRPPGRGLEAGRVSGTVSRARRVTGWRGGGVCRGTAGFPELPRGEG